MDAFEDELQPGIANETMVWLSTEEAAYVAGVSQQTIYGWMRRGHLEFVRGEDGVARIDPANLARLDEMRQVASQSRLRLGTLQRWVTTDD